MTLREVTKYLVIFIFGGALGTLLTNYITLINFQRELLISAIKEGQSFFLSANGDARLIGYTVLERLGDAELALDLIEVRRDKAAVSVLKKIKEKHKDKNKELSERANDLLSQEWAFDLRKNESIQGEDKTLEQKLRSQPECAPNEVVSGIQPIVSNYDMFELKKVNKGAFQLYYYDPNDLSRAESLRENLKKQLEANIEIMKAPIPIQR